MEPIEQTIVTLPLALALGLVFGFSACTISCLPYLGPVFLASEGGIRQSWRTVLPFSLGRLCSYGGLGLLAGYVGQYLGDDAGLGGMRWVLGSAAIMVGLALLLRRTRRTSCSVPVATEQPLQRFDPAAPRTLMPGGLFLLGASMALTPCAPLGTVLFSAALTASAAHGLALGLSFGLGAIALPALIFGIGVAYIGARLREQLRHWSHGVQHLSALLLIAVGGVNLFG
ncbi:sulfite exporter TauE/SafE family protein [Sulfurivermis fontis]|uniref:sulfite exporter TauE/SafE family protein n=1 Tax=Sulfurivermis fontis TaxID=1972068 RepID=UPI000FDB6FFD|nr:sulfite exporter TauE/SafE family protein [Sulfurivermis fontis]